MTYIKQLLKNTINMYYNGNEGKYQWLDYNLENSIKKTYPV